MLLIFDFDGTIVDSAELVYQCLARYAKNTSLSWDELRDLSSREVLIALNISKWSIPKVLLKGRKEFKKNMKTLPLVPGIKEALIKLHKEGHSLHIVSSNSKQNISNFLLLHGLEGIFETISGSFSLFSKDKSLAKLIDDNDYTGQETLYIGDETRDVQAAKKVNISSGAVSWGYNSFNALEKSAPTFLINSPFELNAAIGRLSRALTN